MRRTQFRRMTRPLKRQGMKMGSPCEESISPRLLEIPRATELSMHACGIRALQDGLGHNNMRIFASGSCPSARRSVRRREHNVAITARVLRPAKDRAELVRRPKRLAPDERARAYPAPPGRSSRRRHDSDGTLQP